MNNKLKNLLSKEINLIKPEETEVVRIKENLRETTEILEKNIKKEKIKADIFIGGSFAKNTLIKKENYDVDVFIRFQGYEEEKIADLIKKIVPKNAEKIHGSRDYFRIKKQNLIVEIIPTILVKNPEEGKNITDLSYFHVAYVNKKIKADKKLADEIRLAKAFTHYADCYGAESYIQGFSGYATELLIIFYKNFLNMIKSTIKLKNKEKLIIDIERDYKNNQEILRELNESKLNSPIILIDPTFKQRNALASLSEETFHKFQDYCKAFLKNPSESFFQREDKEKAFKGRHKQYNLVKIKTNKQSGDIAGTKLRKFYNYFLRNISKNFNIKESLFLYDESTNESRIFLAALPNKAKIFNGPPISMKEPLERFKKEHKKIVIKNKQAFAFEEGYKNLKEFLKEFENKNSDTISSMEITSLVLEQ